jgi:hypothetical protein
MVRAAGSPGAGDQATPGTSKPADVSALAGRLDQVTGLARIGRSADGQLWRVGNGGPRATARVQIVGPDGPLTGVRGVGRPSAVGSGSAGLAVPAGPHGSVNTALDPGGPGRVLALSESASSRWRASLDGRPLKAVRLPGAASWQQAFALPAVGGRLQVRSDDRQTRVWRRLQLGLAGVLLVLALPVRRRTGALR